MGQQTDSFIEVKVPSAPKQTTAHTWVEMPMPDAHSILRFCGWASGRVLFSSAVFTVVVSRNTLKLGVVFCDWLESGIKRLLKIYDALPYAGVPMTQVIEANATVINEPLEVISDVISAIEGKQVMIIGEMGTGKSTLAQYLAYTVGGKVKVYECEGTPDDWQGLEVIGKGEDWEAINQGMTEDLEDLSNQLKIRNEKGDRFLEGSEKVIICEEYPELVSKVDSSAEWLERHARRGRKARRFTILLSQYDRVAAWGLEGKSDLADAFYRIRLGKKAQAHAKVLKNTQLFEWLKSDKSHALLDDQPLKLPPYREMKAASMRFNQPVLQQQYNHVNNAQKSAEQSPESLSDAGFSDSSSEEKRLLWRIIQQVSANKSDSAIITEILGYTGKRYQLGAKLLQSLREEYGG